MATIRMHDGYSAPTAFTDQMPMLNLLRPGVLSDLRDVFDGSISHPTPDIYTLERPDGLVAAYKTSALYSNDPVTGFGYDVVVDFPDLDPKGHGPVYRTAFEAYRVKLELPAEDLYLEVPEDVAEERVIQRQLGEATVSLAQLEAAEVRRSFGEQPAFGDPRLGPFLIARSRAAAKMAMVIEAAEKANPYVSARITHVVKTDASGYTDIARERQRRKLRESAERGDADPKLMQDAIDEVTRPSGIFGDNSEIVAGETPADAAFLDRLEREHDLRSAPQASVYFANGELLGFPAAVQTVLERYTALNHVHKSPNPSETVGRAFGAPDVDTLLTVWDNAMRAKTPKKAAQLVLGELLDRPSRRRFLRK